MLYFMVGVNCEVTRLLLECSAGLIVRVERYLLTIAVSYWVDRVISRGI